MSNIILWDIETVPDIKGLAAANGHTGKSDEEVCALIGDKFPFSQSYLPDGRRIIESDGEERYVDS